MVMDEHDAERRSRAAERRGRVSVRVTTTDDETDIVPPIKGLEAMSLAARITRDAWNLAGHPWPDYDRRNIPVRVIGRDALIRNKTAAARDNDLLDVKTLLKND
jgi:hypothetical protein